MKKIIWFATAILLFAMTSCRDAENLPYFQKEERETAKDLMINRNDLESPDSLIIEVTDDGLPIIVPPKK